MSTVIVFAAGEPPPGDIVDDIPTGDLVVAADGGYDVAAELGLPVDVVVGDLDSVDPASLPRHVVVHRHPRDKDATDLELALEMVVADSPERVVVVGGAGGRLDHELAVVGIICSPRWSRVEEIDWLTGRGRAHVVRASRRLHGDIGATLSLLAVGGPATGIHSRGLHWELSDGILEPGSTLGVSNVLVSPVVDLRVETGTVLAVFPGG